MVIRTVEGFRKSAGGTGAGTAKMYGEEPRPFAIRFARQRARSSKRVRAEEFQSV